MKSKIKAACKWTWTAIRIFLNNHCSMHAAGLTYYCMLAMVPVICILLMCAKALGAKEYAMQKMQAQFDEVIVQLESGPDDTLSAVTLQDEAAKEEKRRHAEQLAAQARGLESEILSTVDKIDIDKLGWIGFVMLVWTVLGSIGMVEVSFNEIMSVTKGRPLWRRLLLDALVVVVLPMLSGLALSVTLLKVAKDVTSVVFGSIWVTKWFSDGVIWLLDSWPTRLALTLALSALTFAFLFKVVPNCRVRWRFAWWCGLATAIMFGGWMKICAVAQIGIAKSSALYGSLAFLPIMLAWQYMSWQIVLFGCCALRATHLHAQAAEAAAAARETDGAGES